MASTDQKYGGVRYKGTVSSLRPQALVVEFANDFMPGCQSMLRLPEIPAPDSDAHHAAQKKSLFFFPDISDISA